MKSVKKTFKYLASPFAVGLFLTAALSYTSFVYYENRFELDDTNKHPILSRLHRLHKMTIDWRFHDRGHVPGSDRVAVLAVDDDSVNQEGRWPWPREKTARLIERALEYGAKIIAFDVLFSEPDQNASVPTLKRMRRELASKSQLTSDLDSMISEELERSDGDAALARVFQKYSDRLVMGAYFDVGLQGPSYQDICTDVLFERSYEARYWKNEEFPIQMKDASIQTLELPQEFKSRINDYVTLLEMSKSAEWFADRNNLQTRIETALEDLAEIFPSEAYPGLATLWINNDIENALLVLQDARPDLATPAGARLLFNRFATAFRQNDFGSLSTDIRSMGRNYCHRFFSEADELLNFEKFKQFWGENDEARENFAEVNFRDLWNEIQAERQPAGEFKTLDDLVSRFRKVNKPNRITVADRWWLNIPEIAHVTKHTGHFNSVPDHDGSIRRNLLIVRKGNRYFPSLALETFLLDKGYRAFVEIGDRKTGGKIRGVESLEIRDREGTTVMRVPVDEQGHLMINYSGKRYMFPHISAAEILNERPTMKIHRRIQKENSHEWVTFVEEVPKSEFLKDKILIYGATAIGIYDLRVTPFEENFPGVETHANTLSNLLIEHARQTGERLPASAAGFLRAHPHEAQYMWLLLCGIGVVLSALLSYLGSIPGLGITALFMGGVYAIDRYFFFRNGLVTTVVFPMIEIVGSFMTLTFYKYFTEERKKRELKGTFEKYVSPAIVAEVLKDPENIELGGKKMHLTVMFSDVRGFTTISEKLDPRELTNLLNSYLTPMTDLVFKNKGTLDKYMGDAIMAFWGAPIHFADHAKHACRCALQMLGKLRELQTEYRAKGLPEIDIGIGLNTGDMSVGNMGSETVRSYTVMGDAVNLASRLEGINKEYGTRIIISEFTYEAVKDSFTAREVDWVRVKGKAQPVRIYELVSEGAPPPEMDAALKHFRAGFELYHERKFKEAIECFKEALIHKPDDAPSQIYIKRCEAYLESPPPPDWDGVYNMKTK